jgi:hypothetical protein
MSKVYSFRLDDNNPREAQAREVINAWVSKGYSQRHIFVEALIGLYVGEEKRSELENTLARFTTLLDNLDTSKFIPKKHLGNEISLSNDFLDSIAKSVKPGERSRT